jgi:uncharacterized membrane protein
MAVGAAIRHYFNRRHAGETLWWIPIGCACAIAAIAVWLRPPGEAEPAAGATPVSFAQAQQIVQARCTPCHSMHPTETGFDSPPAGIVLDSPAQIQAEASHIKAVAVDSTFMPFNNATHMTEAERASLGLWLAAGAKIAP